MLSTTLPELGPKPRRNPWVDVAIFGAIALFMVVGAMLRWGALGRESIWFDEGYTAWAASLPVGRLLEVIRADVSPPGYYLLLHYWIALFGQTETALRAMSALLATLSLGAFYLLARRVLKDRLAVVAVMGVFALSVMQIEYAKNARFYTLVTFLSLLSLYALYRFLDLRTRGKFSVGNLAVIVICSTLNLYSHNLMWFYVGMLNFLWLTLPTEESKRLCFKQRIKDLLLADAMIALLYLPWVPGLLEQMQRVHGEFWAATPRAWQLFDVLTLLAGVKSHYPTGMFAKIPMVNRHTPEAVRGVTLSIAGAFLLWEVLRPRGKRSGDLLALAAYAVMPVVLVWVLSQFARPLFLDRVFIASSPIFALIFAAPLARWNTLRPAARTVVVLAIGLMAYWMCLSVNGFWKEEHHEDWRSTYQYISSLPSEGRLILFVANEGEIDYDYYASQHGQALSGEQKLGLPEGFFELDPPRTSRRVLRDSDLDRLKAALASGKYTRVVYVQAHDWYADPDGRVTRYLGEHCRLINQRQFTEDILVDEYVPRR